MYKDLKLKRFCLRFSFAAPENFGLYNFFVIKNVISLSKHSKKRNRVIDFFGVQTIKNDVLIKRKEAVYTDFQKWCREVVWWGNKKGAYLYNSDVIEKSSVEGDVGKLAGHF